VRGDFGPATCPVCGSIGARATMLDHIEAEHAGGLVAVVACEDLLSHRLSSSSGGDFGMVFDEHDAAVERERKGTVTFDRQAVDRFQQAVEEAKLAR
jgi:hypothetical protein